VRIVDYIGLPYKAKGREVSGLDCYGLVYLFYRDKLGLKIPSYSEDYLHSEHWSSVAEAIIKNLPNWVKVDKPKYGDMLVFNILGLPVHTGIYLGPNDFLHSFMKTNSCIERLDSITWNRRLQGIYRWQKI